MLSGHFPNIPTDIEYRSSKHHDFFHIYSLLFVDNVSCFFLFDKTNASIFFFASGGRASKKVIFSRSLAAEAKIFFLTFLFIKEKAFYI